MPNVVRMNKYKADRIAEHEFTKLLDKEIDREGKVKPLSSKFLSRAAALKARGDAVLRREELLEC